MYVGRIANSTVNETIAQGLQKLVVLKDIFVIVCMQALRSFEYAGYIFFVLENFQIKKNKTQELNSERKCIRYATIRSRKTISSRIKTIF